MAWNDPGKNENPWKRKPDQGPPDLDEVLRRLQKKLRAMFGGGPRPVGGSGDGRDRAFGIGYVVAGLLVVWAITGFYQNDASERSVITRFGKYELTTGAGLNWKLPWPIDRRTVVNVTEIASFPTAPRMLTLDEALVDIKLSVQYRRADPVKFTFSVRDPEETLGEVSESAIREVIGQSNLSVVLETGRTDISRKTKDLIQRTIAAYNTGIEIISVNLQEVMVPDQVAPAQADATKAREDKIRASSNAQTYASDIVPKARGRAVSVVEEAEAHKARVIAEAEGETSRFLALAQEYERAPGVTRERLYIETIEKVLASSTKVLVDTDGSGNMIYLPLDKLIEQRSQPRPPVETPPMIRNEDGTAVESADPRARRERQ